MLFRSVKIGKGVKDNVEIIAEEDVGAIVQKGAEKKISSELNLPEYIDAPVRKGQKLGEYLVYNHGQLYKKVNLVAAQDVERAGLLKEIKKILAETYLL